MFRLLKTSKKVSQKFWQMLLSLAEAFKFILALSIASKNGGLYAKRSPESGFGFRGTAKPIFPLQLLAVIEKAHTC